MEAWTLRIGRQALPGKGDTESIVYSSTAWSKVWVLYSAGRKIIHKGMGRAQQSQHSTAGIDNKSRFLIESSTQLLCLLLCLRILPIVWILKISQRILHKFFNRSLFLTVLLLVFQTVVSFSVSSCLKMVPVRQEVCLPWETIIWFVFTL